MTLTADVQTLKSEAKAAIKRNMGFMKWRLRSCSTVVKEQVLNSYARSLLIYFGTPLVAAEIWKQQDVDALEKQLFREMLLLPNDIGGDLILNVA